MRGRTHLSPVVTRRKGEKKRKRLKGGRSLRSCHISGLKKKKQSCIKKKETERIKAAKDYVHPKATSSISAAMGGKERNCGKYISICGKKKRWESALIKGEGGRRERRKGRKWMTD